MLSPNLNADSQSTCSDFWVNLINSIFPLPIIQSIVAILLIFLQAVMINRLVIKHRITKAYTLFPGMIYILMTAAFTQHLALDVYTIANTFAIASLYSTFALYKKYKPEVAIFRSGFWTALAAMFSPVYWLLLLPQIFGFASLRSFNIRELLQMVLGILSVLIITSSLVYFFKADYFWQSITRDHFSSLHLESLAPYLPFFILLILVVISVVLMQSTFLLRKSLPSKKKISVLYLVLLTSIPSILLTCDGNPNVLYYLWIVLPIFVSMIIIQMKNLAIAEVLHLILLAVIINTHFQFFQFI